MPKQSKRGDDVEVGGDAAKPRRAFPTPRYVFTIFSPKIVTITDRMEDIEGVSTSVWKQFTTITSSSDGEVKKRAKKIKMHSLIVKMLNRLIQDEILPREAIQYRTGDTFVLIKILTPPSLLPVLMQKCERIGVGNAVGHCYAVPLETSAHPTPGPIKELELLPDAASVVLPESTTSTQKGTEEDEEDAQSVSSDEDENVTATTTADESTISSSSPTKPLGVRLLTAKQKAELTEKIREAREEWLGTASRIRVEQVAEQIAAGAAFTWDYMLFVFCAATIAAVGLMTDSATSVLASMLVSPIMGPVLGFTFGTTLRRKSMILTSLRNEAMSLVICVFVGAFWGIIGAVAHVDDRRDWPSSEMASRGDVTGLVSGILIALPSGMATALSTLGKNSSGMVGVAISLSLLPPAVNAGICWFYAIMLNTDVVDRNEGDTEDYAVLGTISFCLTLVNIVCIWLAGVFTFWLKEVSPYEKKNAFWSRDIQAYREGHGKADIDIAKINDGIEAAIELQEAAGKNVYKQDYEHKLSARKIGEARRKGLAGNVVEDAFFMDTDFGLHNEVIAGGAASDALPDEITFQNVVRDADEQAPLVRNMKRCGGNIEAAGEALFDDNLFDIGGSSMFGDHEESLPSDTGIDHADVADAILLQGLY